MNKKITAVVLAAALCIGPITYTSFNQKETQPVSAGDFTDNGNDENSEGFDFPPKP